MLKGKNTNLSNYSRRDFIRLCAGAAAGTMLSPFLSNLAGAEQKRPNIIFILADDLGWGDLGCYGHPYIKTPNLDKIASQGTLFTNFYANAAVCSPSRTAFTTGQFPARVGIHDFLKAELSPEQVRAGVAQFLDPKVMTLPRALKQAGYTTGHFGKWHLGTGKGAPQATDYGIDEFRIVIGKGPSWEERGQPFFHAKSTELFVDEAIQFVEKNKDTPFYLNLWTLVPHAPLNPTEEQMKPYEDLRPRVAPDRGAMSVYYSSVTDMDKQLGRLFAKLDELGLTDNTIIIFSSDNGPEDIHLSESSHSGIGCQGPFRGRKRSLYEGGTRMPFIVKWPGVVPAGKVNNSSTVTAVDFLPTFTSIANANVPSNTPQDGENITDILKGNNRQRKKPIYWEWRFGQVGDQINFSPQLAMREGDWKLLMNHDSSRIELYNIPKDPMEVDNVADNNPKIVKQMSEKLLAWKKTLPPGEYAGNAGKLNYPWPGGK